MATARFSYALNYDPSASVSVLQDLPANFYDLTAEISIGPDSTTHFAVNYGSFDDLETGTKFEDTDYFWLPDYYSAYFDFSDRLGAVHMMGGSGGDTLIGGAGDDEIWGGDGDDTLVGGGGDDTLVGGGGADSFNGGAGIDTVSYANARRGVFASLYSNLSPSGSDAVGDTYVDVENLTGSNHNDFLIGDGSANVLIGGLGNDLLYGADDNAIDTLNGGRGHDTLYGGVDDILIGGKGNDKIYINGAAQTVDGGTGIDKLVIVDGSLVFDAGDKITGIEKVVLSGSIVNVDFSAVVSRGLDVTSEATDTAVILGTTGNDTLRAGSHGDLLIAGAGNDTLIAGSGPDTIRIGAVHGRVEIRDYDIANDQLDFSESGAGSLSDLTITQFGSKTVINIAGETNAQRIVLTNTDSSTLIANGSLFFGMD